MGPILTGCGCIYANSTLPPKFLAQDDRKQVNVHVDDFDNHLTQVIVM